MQEQAWLGVLITGFGIHQLQDPGPFYGTVDSWIGEVNIEIIGIGKVRWKIT